MEKKGLCDTCENEKSCIFQGKFSVLECEEFSNYVNRKGSIKAKPKNTHLSQVATEAE